jgi:hypothetical protein
VLAYALERRPAAAPSGRPTAEAGRSPLELGLLAVAVVLGALLFAGSLAEEGFVWWPGLVAGALCAALGYAAVAGLLGRARRRVGGSAAALLTVYAEGFALLLAGVAILIPPLSLAALVLFAVLVVRGRAAGERKFQGLRILR